MSFNKNMSVELEDITDMLAVSTGRNSHLVFQRRPESILMVAGMTQFYVYRCPISEDTTLRYISNIVRQAGLRLGIPYTLDGQRLPVTTYLRYCNNLQWKY